ncbi:MAG: hypothetical protein AAF656_03985 [Planctomycetota bacterium]
MNTLTEDRNGLQEALESNAPIEETVKKVPTDAMMLLAGGSIAASLTLKLMGRDRDAMFVGQWAPTFVALGIFNKLARQSRS